MPQTSDQLNDQPVQLACDGVTESNERLTRPSQKSLCQKNGVPTPPSENGSVKSGIGRIHSNGLVVSTNGSVQSHAKSQINGYVL